MITPAEQESPSCWIPPGVLEAGRSYYWKVRGSKAVSGEIIHSYWSPAMFFSVKPGFMVSGEHLGPALLEPANGTCFNYKAPIRFSWSPLEGAKKYEFVLAADAQLNDVIVSYITQSTSYEYRDKLKTSKPYFWQVKVVAPVPGDPSPVGTFTLMENNRSPLDALLSAVNSGAVLPGLLTGVIIVVAAVLMVVIFAYIFVSRRRY